MGNEGNFVPHLLFALVFGTLTVARDRILTTLIGPPKQPYAKPRVNKHLGKAQIPSWL